MKVIQIMPEFGLAGAETMCENLSIALEAAGIDVVVVSLYDYHSAITERLEANGIRVVYLNKKPGFDISQIFVLWNLLREEKPCVVHTHRYITIYAIPAAILAGVKRRVHTVHNVAKMENSLLHRKINAIFFRLFHVTPVALSQEVQKTVVDEYHINAQNIPIVFNGVNLTKCIKKVHYDVNHNNFTFLHIGRFAPAKNHIALLQAFDMLHQEYPQTKIRLIGDGERKADAVTYVKEHKLMNAVEFVGLLPSCYEAMNQADAFLLPSVWEGVPMTLIEAMGTALPIIASDVGGIPDMLQDHESALIIKPDVNSIYKAMKEMLFSTTLRKKLGENAFARAQEFSAEKMAAQYFKIYKE